MWIRNDVQLVSKINKIIRSILIGGLDVVWREQSKIMHVPDEWDAPWTPINLEQMHFLYYCVFFPALTISAAMLCAEIYIAKKNTTNKW